MKTKEDYVLWLKLSQKYKIYGLQKTLASWRKNKSKLSYSFQKIKSLCLFKISKFNLIKSLLFVILLSLNFIKKFYTKNMIIKTHFHFILFFY